MKKIFAIFAVVFVLAGCGPKTIQDEISKEIKMDVSDGIEVSNYNEYGGFHGDGCACVALQFEDDTIVREIADNQEWKSLPMDKTAQILAYGITEEKEDSVAVSGPYLTDADGNTLLPSIQNGYYYLMDRQEDDGENMLDRYSLNFTLTVYDTDKQVLYYCKMDT